MPYVAVIGESSSRPKAASRRHAIRMRMRLGTVTLAAVTIGLGVVMSILYFMQINRLTLSGYEITRLESQVRTIKEDNRRLQYVLSQRKALNYVDRQAKERLKMVTAEEIQYWWKNDPDYVASVDIR